MTAKQITRKLTKAGLDISNMNIERDEVECIIGYAENENGFGYCDREATEALFDKVVEVLGWEGGYGTQYGSWVATPSVGRDLGDWNDVASAHHY